MISVNQIITKARRSTNTSDIDAVSLLLCQDYLNRIQSEIEDNLYLVNDENDLFIKDYNFNLIIGQDSYDLPSDIYAKSSIDTLAVSFLNGISQTFLPLKKVSRKQRGFTFGYFVEQNKMILTPRPASPLAMKLSYQQKIPDLGIRGGKVSSVTPTTIVITDYVSGFEGESDYICVVDGLGTIIAEGLEFTFNGSNTFTVSSTTGITSSHYVVSGKRATTHSWLPKECEKILITALERMIAYRQSSPDFNTSSILSKDEINLIKEVFADNSYDDAKPPVTEWQEWLP